MNWKLIVVGGLAFYMVMFIVSMATGPIIHEGVLDPIYMEHEEFWRPELTQDPPDMAALMPMWITNGLISAFLMATIFSCVRPALKGSGVVKGVQYGLIVGTFSALFCLGWFGIFNLPGTIWMWWAAEGFIYYTAGGAVLGWVGAKLAPEG